MDGQRPNTKNEITKRGFVLHAHPSMVSHHNLGIKINQDLKKTASETGALAAQYKNSMAKI